MRNVSKKVCVCCPACGKLHEKSMLAESEINCAKCGTKFIAIVRDGRVTTYEADLEGDDALLKAANWN